MTSSDSAALHDCKAKNAESSSSELLAPRDQFALAEYNNLRAEILKMIELQSQLINLTVIAFGAVVSVGFQARSPAIMALRPILPYFSADTRNLLA
ncbi:MAG: hypothetical protein M3460_16280 [Actinomycetota bacterium]|nr:hypothetical protein [Actinomycetota bacterium]